MKKYECKKPCPKRQNREFPGGSVAQGCSIVTAVALVTAVAWVQSLAQKLHSKAQPKNKKMKNRLCTAHVKRKLIAGFIFNF